MKVILNYLKNLFHFRRGQGVNLIHLSKLDSKNCQYSFYERPTNIWKKDFTSEDYNQKIEREVNWRVDFTMKLIEKLPLKYKLC